MAEKPKQTEKKNPNSYLKYSGMGMQLLVLLFISAWIGQKLDAKMENEIPYISAALILFSVISYLYKVYVDLTKNP